MHVRSVAVIASLLCASPALAQRISVPNFTGPNAATVRTQLVGSLCDSADCITPVKTTTGNRPDWKKAKKEVVKFFVTGKVVKKGSTHVLELAVLNKAGPPKAKRSFTLEKNVTLSAGALAAAMEFLTKALGGKAPPPEPAPAPEEPARATPTPVVPRPAAPPPSEPAPARPSRTEFRGEDVTTDARPDRPPPPPPASRGSKPHFLVIDAGADVLNRRLAWSQVATANLRSYDLALFGQPAIGVQFYPLAMMRDDLLAGLGAEVGFAFAPWLQSRLASSPEAFPTSATRIDGGLRFRIIPSKSFPLSITPSVGLRSQSFTVGALSDGRRLDGLPNIAFLGLRAGVGLEVPVIAERLLLFGRFGIIPVFSAGEIISSAFFPNGSAFGFEANAGVGVGLTSFLQVRASFEFASYGLSFQTQATDTYVAAGASDTYLGGNASVRLMF
jgi:hypothetical protein